MRLPLEAVEVVLVQVVDETFEVMVPAAFVGARRLATHGRC